MFQGPIVVSSPKDKADVFAQQFAANSTLDDNGRSPPGFPLQTHTSIKLPVITPRKVAFDRIWHKGLLHKLKSYGITGPYHAIISDFLTHCQIKVVLNGPLINSGVPQGSIFGPTLFLLFINDLPDALQSQVALYANDSTIFCSSLGRRDASRTELCSMLDRDLTQVLASGQNWIVTFNDHKTKLISVSRSKDRNFAAVHMGPQVLAYS